MVNLAFRRQLWIVVSLLVCTPAAKLPAQTNSNVDNQEPLCKQVLAEPLKTPPYAKPLAESELPHCDAEALYYGFDKPSDPAAALQCAYYHRAHPDPTVGDPFAGPGILSMLYANGKGVKRDYDLAIRFTCENHWAAPAEIAGRLARFVRLRDTHTAITNFDLCDDATSGLMQGACESVAQRFKDAKREKELNTIKGQWTPPVQEKFKSLVTAEKEFEDSRTEYEVDLTGSGRAAFSLQEQGRLRDQFLINLQRFGKGDIPNASSVQVRELDQKLNAAYQQIQNTPAEKWKYGTIKPSGIRETERSWIKLRDAWVEFGRLAYPNLSSDRITAQITRLRLHQLKSFIQQEYVNHD
jgi:uncharacterized protein YecT (DUF1311 family)